MPFFGIFLHILALLLLQISIRHFHRIQTRFLNNIYSKNHLVRYNIARAMESYLKTNISSPQHTWAAIGK